MKIMIMKCERKELWYNNCIGKVFEVSLESDTDYFVKKKKEHIAVSKDDAEVI